jgi:hypothetical protein
MPEGEGSNLPFRCQMVRVGVREKLTLTEPLPVAPELTGPSTLSPVGRSTLSERCSIYVSIVSMPGPSAPVSPCRVES